jgi:hypothetical protein
VAADFTIGQGDSGPEVISTITDDDNNVADITGASVTFIMVADAAGSPGSVLISKPGVIRDPALDTTPGAPTYPHQAEYDWALDGSDTVTPTEGGPPNKFTFVIVFADGRKITFPNVEYALKPTLEVTKKLG